MKQRRFFQNICLSSATGWCLMRWCLLVTLLNLVGAIAVNATTLADDAIPENATVTDKNTAIPENAAVVENAQDTEVAWTFNDYVLRDGLGHAWTKFEAGGPARVVFMGGSVTTRQWREPVMDYLHKRFPKAEFDFVMAGIGGTDANLGAFRLPQDVLSRGSVDLFVLEFAVNGGGVRAMEGIVRQAKRTCPDIDTMILYFANVSHVTDAQKKQIPGIVADHEQVADHYMLPSLHLYKDVADRLDAKQAVWDDWFTDVVHPNQAGCDVYSDDLIQFFERAWTLSASAANKAVDTDDTDATTTNANADVSTNATASDSNATVRETMAADVSTIAPLDEYCYEYGHYVAPTAATELQAAAWHEGWTADKTCNYGGPLDVLEATEPNAEIHFAFNGSAVGAYLIVGFDAGMIEVRIDGGEPQKVDLYDHYCTMFHRPAHRIFADELARGPHTIQIRVLSDANEKSIGHAIRIVQWMVN